MVNSKSEIPSPKLSACAALWMALLLVVAFTLPLPNNHWSNREPMYRWQLALEFLDSPAEKPAPGGPGALSSGWQFLPQRFDLIAVAAVILAGAWGAGHLVFRLLRPPLAAKSLERTVLAVGIGLAALSLTTLGAGLAGALSRPLLGSVLATCVIAEMALRLLPPFARGGKRGSRDVLTESKTTTDLPSVADARSEMPSANSEIRNPKSEFAPDGPPLPPPYEGGERSMARSGRWLVLAVAAPFLWFMLLGALLPSVDFDVNEYHFQGPKEFFQAGRVSFLEHNVYTSFPFGTEMLTLLAMVLRDDWYRGALAGKAVLMGFGPLTALALFAAGRRWIGTAAGGFAAILYLSTPWVYRISTIAYAEGGLAFYLFASLLAVMIAVEQIARNHATGVTGESAANRIPSPLTGEAQGGGVSQQTLAPPPQPSPTRGEGERAISPPRGECGAALRQLLLAGLLAGSAMACKYPGLVSVVIPLGLTVCVVAWVKHGASPLRWKMPLAFAAGVLIAVGPWLLKNAVETGNPVYPLAYRVFGGRDWDDAVDARWRKAHSPDSYSLSSLAGLALDVAARNDWVNPLLFALAPLALCAAATRRRARWLWLYTGWLFLACWLFTHRIDRFWVPLLPVVALLAGAGASWWRSALPRGLSRSALLLPLILLGLFHLKFITTPLGGYNEYLADLDVAEQFAAKITAPELAWLSENLPPASKVLSVGDAAVFEARLPVVYSTVFDRSPFEAWCAARPGEGSGELRDASAIREKLAAEGITHVYVCWREILRYRSPGNYGYTAFVTPERFTDLQRLGVLGRALAAPGGVKDLDDLDPQWRQELETWGQELITHSGKNPAYITYQVFPVNHETRESHENDDRQED